MVAILNLYSTTAWGLFREDAIPSGTNHKAN
jgi:hypothetical protein